MSNESIVAEVVAASIGGAFSASALYPLEVLKTKMQAEAKGSSNKSAKKNQQPRHHGSADVKKKIKSSDASTKQKKAMQQKPRPAKKKGTSEVGAVVEKEPEETAEETGVIPMPSSSSDDDYDGEVEEGVGSDGGREKKASSASVRNKKKSKAAPEEGFHKYGTDRDDEYDDDDYEEEMEDVASRKGTQAKPLGMIPYAAMMYREGGIGAFYAGIETSAIQSAMEKSLYFFAYTFFKNAYKTITGLTKIDTLPNLVLGCMAEWAHLPVTLPIDCLTTAIQTDKTGRGAFTLMAAMLSEKGIGGMYKGVQAYAVLCLKPAIQYTVYEQVKRVVLLERRIARKSGAGHGHHRHTGGNGDIESLSAAEAFLLGMVARTVATIITFPYVRAKVMLQSTYADRGIKGGIPAMILEMYREGGLTEVFQGIGPELTRGIFSAALMMMAKEKISVFVNALVGPEASSSTTSSSSTKTGA